MQAIFENCQLQIDTERGVCYVHSPKGYTVLRLKIPVANLPRKIVETTNNIPQLDVIALDAKVSYSE